MGPRPVGDSGTAWDKEEEKELPEVQWELLVTYIGSSGNPTGLEVRRPGSRRSPDKSLHLVGPE